MDFVGSLPGGDTDPTVVRKFDLRELRIAEILPFIDNHGQHLGHRVFHTIPPPLSFGWWEQVAILRTLII